MITFKSPNKIIINHNNIQDYKVKEIHLRGLNDDYLNEFLSLIVPDDKDKVKPKYDKLSEEDIDWDGMPEMENHPDNWGDVNIICVSDCDREYLSSLTKQKITPTTKSVWYPSRPILDSHSKYYTTKEVCIPKYPIYIISKGRSEVRHTVKTLEEMNVPYKIVIEMDEFDDYVKVIPIHKILILPKSYRDRKDQGGSIPARNFVWDHSKSNGDDYHWILDDNINGFYRFNRNSRTQIKSGVCFMVIENYIEKYTNVGLAGMNYFSFCPNISKGRKKIQMNTRIYSCILVRNNLPFRWRGVYNEDTDLSLNVLKSGMSTMLFNCFLCNKMETLSMKGGNTDSIYKEDGMKKKYESLKEQHPELVKPYSNFGKEIHHLVNYKPFQKNKLIPIPFSTLKEYPEIILIDKSTP